jgi:Mg/Co/Ni transporter MgtE
MTIVSLANVIMAPASITALRPRRPTPEGPSNLAATGLVADVVKTTFVRIPAWFTTAQARKVAALKGVDHLLVEEHGRVSGSIGVAALFKAGPSDTVARWMSRSRGYLTPELTLPEAEQRLRCEGVSCLPVVTGGLLLGTVCLDDVGGDIAHAA